MSNGTDDRARRRYVLLMSAFGEEPDSILERKLLTTLSQWLGDGDVDHLTTMIRRATGRQSVRAASLIREVAELLDHPHPMSTEDYHVVGLPVGLVRRIRQEATRA